MEATYLIFLLGKGSTPGRDAKYALIWRVKRVKKGLASDELSFWLFYFLLPLLSASSSSLSLALSLIPRSRGTWTPSPPVTGLLLISDLLPFSCSHKHIKGSAKPLLHSSCCTASWEPRQALPWQQHHLLGVDLGALCRNVCNYWSLAIWTSCGHLSFDSLLLCGVCVCVCVCVCERERERERFKVLCLDYVGS